MKLLTVVLAILGFGIIIVIHELGHFLAARANGVRVNEFAIGMGPKLFGFGKGETLYSVRLFPIGGYCAMEGENPEEEGDDAPDETFDPARSFAHKKVWQRFVITVAGVVMNFLLGFILLLVYLGGFTRPNANGDVLYSTATLHTVPETAMSYRTGLRSGDTFLTINGHPIFSEFDLVNALQSDEDGVFDMTVRRDGEKLRLEGVTFEMKEDPDTGARVLIYDFIIRGERQTVWTTVKQAARTECSLGIWVFTSFGDLIRGKYGLNELSGPVGTVGVISDAVSQSVATGGWSEGFANLIYLLALITVNVGVFNLFPLPALDGGRLLLLVIEGITRRKLPAKVESIINLVGLAALLLFMLIITGSDIWKIFVK